MAYEQQEFLRAEAQEIEKHKWIESEKNGFDLGNRAKFDWIVKYAKTFREEWELEHGKQID